MKLSVHATSEEEIFYPAARRAGVESDLLDEAEVEHASAKGLSAPIRAQTPDEDLYDAKLKVLGEYIGHHVRDEEVEMSRSAVSPRWTWRVCRHNSMYAKPH
jgi:hypothetical protein